MRTSSLSPSSQNSRKSPQIPTKKTLQVGVLSLQSATPNYIHNNTEPKNLLSEENPLGSNSTSPSTSPTLLDPIEELENTDKQISPSVVDSKTVIKAILFPEIKIESIPFFKISGEDYSTLAGDFQKLLHLLPSQTQVKIIKNVDPIKEKSKYNTNEKSADKSTNKSKKIKKEVIDKNEKDISNTIKIVFKNFNSFKRILKELKDSNMLGKILSFQLKPYENTLLHNISKTTPDPRFAEYLIKDCGANQFIRNINGDIPIITAFENARKHEEFEIVVLKLFSYMSENEKKEHLNPALKIYLELKNYFEIYSNIDNCTDFKNLSNFSSLNPNYFTTHDKKEISLLISKSNNHEFEGIRDLILNYINQKIIQLIQSINTSNYDKNYLDFFKLIQEAESNNLKNVSTELTRAEKKILDKSIKNKKIRSALFDEIKQINLPKKKKNLFLNFIEKLSLVFIYVINFIKNLFFKT